ncbi:hypothetical protein KI387_038829, partial [Taxus chinensis]
CRLLVFTNGHGAKPLLLGYGEAPIIECKLTKTVGWLLGQGSHRNTPLNLWKSACT